MDLAERKAALRRAMAERRREVPAADAERAGRAVARLLAGAPELARCERLSLYAPAHGEVSPLPLLATARTRGLGVLWPRTIGGALEFAACGADSLVAGRYGVAEPPPSCPAVALGAVDLVLVPALALDAAGNRLGRGAGHYDRTFAAAPAPFLVGVGYDWQLVDAVPAGEGDRRVDMVVTDLRLLRTGARSVR